MTDHCTLYQSNQISLVALYAMLRSRQSSTRSCSCNPLSSSRLLGTLVAMQHCMHVQRVTCCLFVEKQPLPTWRQLKYRSPDTPCAQSIGRCTALHISDESDATAGLTMLWEHSPSRVHVAFEQVVLPQSATGALDCFSLISHHIYRPEVCIIWQIQAPNR